MLFQKKKFWAANFNVRGIPCADRRSYRASWKSTFTTSVDRRLYVSKINLRGQNVCVCYDCDVYKLTRVKSITIKYSVNGIRRQVRLLVLYTKSLSAARLGRSFSVFESCVNIFSLYRRNRTKNEKKLIELRAYGHRVRTFLTRQSLNRRLIMYTRAHTALLQQFNTNVFIYFYFFSLKLCLFEFQRENKE